MTNINFDLLEKTPIAVELTSQGKILFVNQKYLEIHGYTGKSEVIGRHVMEFQPEEIRLEQQQIGSSRERGEEDVPYIYTSKGLRSDGSIFPIWIHAYRVMYKNNPSILSYIEDMTSEINREELEAEFNKKFAKKLNKNREKIKRYKELLAQENKKYRTLFDLSPIGVIGHQDQKIKFVNPALVEMLGYDSQDELLDQPIFYIISSEEHESVKSKVITRQLEQPDVFETKLISKQDNEVPVIVSAEIIDVPDGHELHFVYLMDISERKILQEEKEKLQKRVKLEERMNVVGHLAGGIAHDFNNLLSVILGNAELLKMFYSDDRGANLIDEIMKTTNRAAELNKKNYLRYQKTRLRNLRLFN